MDSETLRRDVRAFREALDACYGNLDRTIFGCFPRGCCGPVSEILAAFLENRGHGAFAYVCGIGVDSNGRHSSHAWLEREDLIVDVTRDQFGKCLGPVFINTDRSWHEGRFPIQKKEDYGGLSYEFRTASACIMAKIHNEGGEE